MVMREARGGGEGGRDEEDKEGKTDVRVPERVVKEGVRVVRGVLEEVVDLDAEVGGEV